MDLTPADIFDIIEDDRESRGRDDFSYIDPVYCILDHILRMARNEINDVLSYDFINDLTCGEEIYTYGNFMCSIYIASDEAMQELIEKLGAATSEQLRQLRDNSFVAYFLEQVEIDINIKEPA